jgi:site-specific recombinase XerD
VVWVYEGDQRKRKTLAEATPAEIKAKARGVDVPVPRDVRMAQFRRDKGGKGQELTLGELFQIWEIHQSGRVEQEKLNPESFRSERIVLNGFVSAHSDKMLNARFPFAESTERWLDSLKSARRQGKPASPAYRDKCFRRLRRFFDFAVERKNLAENPLHEIEHEKVTSARERTLTEDEIEAIRVHGSKAFVTFFDLSLNTGARPKELATLEARHLTYPMEGVVTATLQPKEWKNGKTGKTRYIVFTGDEAEVIRKAAEQYPQGKILRNTQGNIWVEQCKTKEVRRWEVCMRTIKENAGLAEDVCTYMARSYFITQQIRNGASIEAVAQACGTSSAQIRQAYLHEREEMILEAALSFRKI